MTNTTTAETEHYYSAADLELTATHLNQADTSDQDIAAEDSRVYNITPPLVHAQQEDEVLTLNQAYSTNPDIPAQGHESSITHVAVEDQDTVLIHNEAYEATNIPTETNESYAMGVEEEENTT